MIQFSDRLAAILREQRDERARPNPFFMHTLPDYARVVLEIVEVHLGHAIVRVIECDDESYVGQEAQVTATTYYIRRIPRGWRDKLVVGTKLYYRTETLKNRGRVAMTAVCEKIEHV